MDPESGRKTKLKKRRSVTQLSEWPLIVEKSTVCPPPPFCVQLDMPSF